MGKSAAAHETNQAATANRPHVSRRNCSRSVPPVWDMHRPSKQKMKEK